MSSTPHVRPLTAAYVEMLTEKTGKHFSDTDAPGDYDTPTEKPYGVVTRIAGGESFGDPSRPAGMATVVYQVTCVGERADQAEWLNDAVLDVTLELDAVGYVNALTVPGLVVYMRAIDMDGGIVTDGTLVNAVRRYAFTVSAT